MKRVLIKSHRKDIYGGDLINLLSLLMETVNASAKYLGDFSERAALPIVEEISDVRDPHFGPSYKLIKHLQRLFVACIINNIAILKIITNNLNIIIF